MGGFFLRKVEKDNSSAMEQTGRDAIDVFRRKGLKSSAVLRSGQWAIYVFHKTQYEVENVVQYANGDFIVGVGTFLYQGNYGKVALEAVFRNSSEETPVVHLWGQYCIIIRKGGRTRLYTDYCGLYPVYHDQSRNMISSSFLAIAAAAGTNKILDQEAYEYILYGTFFGSRTYVSGINFLSSEFAWKLGSSLEQIERRKPQGKLRGDESFEHMVEQTAHTLRRYFSDWITAFNGEVGAALTGGLDSRLMLAAARSAGLDLKLFVGGSEHSKDVIAATTIARGEGFKLGRLPADCFPEISTDDFRGLIEKLYYCHDGLGIVGAFDYGSGIDVLEQLDVGKLFINGGAGSIYRDPWKLPDREIAVRDFVKNKYFILRQSSLNTRFCKKEFIDQLERKISNMFEDQPSALPRVQLTQLYARQKIRYWMAFNNSIVNQFSYYLTPFTEWELVEDCAAIPYAFKAYNRFEMALICKLAPRLAKYPSAYGYNFSNGPSRRQLATEWLKIQTPVNVRPLIRKVVQIASRFRKESSMPFYLSSDYLAEIFGTDWSHECTLVRPNKIREPGMLSRAMTVELTRRGTFFE